MKYFDNFVQIRRDPNQYSIFFIDLKVWKPIHHKTKTNIKAFYTVL